MFQKYASFLIADFVADEKLIAWVRRPTPQSDQFWQEFQEVFPHQVLPLQKAKQAVSLLIEESVDSTNASEDAQIVWSGIQKHLENGTTKVINFRPIKWMHGAAAAIILLTIGMGWWLSRSGSPATPETYQALVEEAKSVQSMEEIINTSKNPLLINLPDDSRVTLEKDSRISFAKNFDGKTREVFLTGAAFFNVTKNAEKPFLVYSDELVTKVLGTSFRVQSFEEEKNIVVSVKTGRVSVYAHKTTQNADPETSGMLLTPNQEIQFARADQRFKRTLVEKPTLVLTQQELKKYSFENAPVSEIFTALETAYGVDIVFDEETLSSCRLTTSLSAETLFDKLAVICEGIGASYKVVDAQVVVTGRGCI